MTTDQDLGRNRSPIVENPAAAQILLDHERRRYLEPFMRGERSTSEAAQELGVAVKDMAYRVQRMAGAGLVQATSEERRAGRSVKRYRAPTGFFLPFATVPEADVEAMFESLLRPLRAGLLRGLVRAVTDTAYNVLDWGYSFELNDEGHVSVVPLARPEEPPDRIVQRLLQSDAPAVYLSYAPLQLDHTRAKRLQHDLNELVRRYQGGEGPDTYWVSVGLAPVG